MLGDVDARPLAAVALAPVVTIADDQRPGFAAAVEVPVAAETLAFVVIGLAAGPPFLARLDLLPAARSDGDAVDLVAPLDHEGDGLELAGVAGRLRTDRAFGLPAFAETAGARIHGLKVGGRPLK